MAVTPDYLSIVESCYASASDDNSWVDGLLDSIGGVLRPGPGFGISLLREQPSGVKVVLSVGRGAIAKALPISSRFMEHMRGSAYRSFFYPRKPIVYANPIFATFNPVIRASWDAILRAGGADDLLGMLGYPAPGWSFTVFLAVGRGTKVDTRLRAALERIRIHVESGMRLRLLGAEQAVAVLSAGGKVLHLENDEVKSHGDQLGGQAKAIDTGRTRAQRERGLRVWTALVDGRWSLVERTDTDGQRHYLAFENTPQAQAYRALTARESIVVDQSIQGTAGKYIAYSTGLTPSRVSGLLTSAAFKLGFRDRLELVRVASALRSHGKFGLLSTPLTEAERDVWRLAAEGLTNAEIATTRGASVRTVVNQVASLFRKIGVESRAGLIAASVEQAGSFTQRWGGGRRAEHDTKAGD